MTIPEIFAHHWQRTDGDILECVRLVLEAHTLERKRPCARAEVGDQIYEDARRLIERIAAAHSMTGADLRGKSQVPRITIVRRRAMLMVRVGIGLAYPVIGKLFGGRDHSTVIVAVEKAERTTDAATMKWLREMTTSVLAETQALRAA